MGVGIAFMVAANGSGLYIGAALGPGPRDGLMTGPAARGAGSVGTVRTGPELTTLATGFLLGGSVGIGTLAFAATIGPHVQFFLSRLAVDPATMSSGDRPRRDPRPFDQRGNP